MGNFLKMLRIRDYIRAIVLGPIYWFLIMIVLSLIFEIESEVTTTIFLVLTPLYIFLSLCYRALRINLNLKYRAKERIKVDDYINQQIYEEKTMVEELNDSTNDDSLNNKMM